MSVEHLEILLVEDNPADVRLTKEAIRDVKIEGTLHVVKDGVEALAYLRREGRFADALRPHLIFLDLNLPRKNGKEVLAEIKEDDAFKRIPVIVLTTSTAESDITQSYNLHANAYVVKPNDTERFSQMLEVINQFWHSTASLASQ